MKISKDMEILRDIFSKYIVKNPFNRLMVFPVLLMMILAKYLEALAASKTKAITSMIVHGKTQYSIVTQFALISLSAVILVELQSFLICKAGQIGYRVSSKDTYKYFLELNPQEFNSIGKGEIQATINRKSQAIQDMIDVISLNFFPTFLSILFISIEVFKNLGLISLLIVNMAIAIYAILTIKITIWRNGMRKNLITAQNKTSNVLMDGLYNYETIFAYNSEDSEIQKFNNSLKNIENHSTDISRSLYVLNLAQRSIWGVMTIVIIFYSVFFDKKKLTGDNFTFLLYIISIMIKNLDNLGFMYGKFQAALINVRLTNLKSRKKKLDGYRTVYKVERVISGIGINIVLAGKTIIKNGHFKIKKGEKVAVIGKNGSGKSSLIKSLIKLIDSEGTILIDDLNTKDFNEASFKNLISYIPQNVVLFDDTVMENIKYGNYKICDEEVLRVSKQLGIHESIMKLEGGYYTKVGEQGKCLSGGERQKILILRSVLRSSQIMLMDEPTSNLDQLSEERIMKEILKDQNLTVMAVVHNLELLENFDKFLWINEGSIKEIKDKNMIDFNSWYSVESNAIKVE